MKNKYDELLRKGSTNEVYEDIKKEYFTLIANMIDEQFQLDTSWMTEKELNECYGGHFPYLQSIAKIDAELDPSVVFHDSSKEEWKGNPEGFAHHQKVTYYLNQIEHIKDQYKRYKEIKESLKERPYDEQIRVWKQQLPIPYRQFARKSEAITEPLYKADRLDNVIRNHTHVIPDGEFYDVISITELMVLFYLENVQNSYENA